MIETIEYLKAQMKVDDENIYVPKELMKELKIGSLKWSLMMAAMEELHNETK